MYKQRKKNKNKQKGVFPNTIIKLCPLKFFYVLSSCPINYSILNQLVNGSLNNSNLIEKYWDF